MLKQEQINKIKSIKENRQMYLSAKHGAGDNVSISDEICELCDILIDVVSEIEAADIKTSDGGRVVQDGFGIVIDEGGV